MWFAGVLVSQSRRKVVKKYELTDEERMDIAERELPDEEFFQDGELSLKQALKNLVWLVDNRRISRITFDYYMEEYL
tara:strand:+ start:229 stop:459 length:231 start_codon:yes stop_codon:yes gene_type:complete